MEIKRVCASKKPHYGKRATRRICRAAVNSVVRLKEYTKKKEITKHKEHKMHSARQRGRQSAHMGDGAIVSPSRSDYTGELKAHRRSGR